MTLTYNVNDIVIVKDHDRERTGVICSIDETSEYPYRVYFLAGYRNNYDESEIKCKLESVSNENTRSNWI